MSAAPAPAVETNHPEPHQNRPTTNADYPTNPSRLLTLVRLLITYGTRLASALQQRTPATNLFHTTLHFGTVDIDKILACITRGLQRAAELEARLLHRLAHPRAAPTAHSAPSRSQSLAPPPSDQAASAPDPEAPRLPTPAQIAAALRRRPIGAVLADICRDLGIVPANPLWQELSLAIIINGGNLATLFNDTYKRLSTFLLHTSNPAHYMESGAHLVVAMMPGTGPP